MPILHKELVDTTNEIAKELFRLIIKNHHVTELKKLLNGYERFYNETLLEASDLFLINEYDPDHIIPLNYELRRIAYYASKDDNRKYWMDSLKKWIVVTTPLNCVYREGWIFYEYYSYFPFEDNDTKNSIDEREEKNNEIRKTTLAKLVQSSEPNEVASLVQCSKDDYQMGFFFAYFVDVFFAKHSEKDLLISVLGSILGKSREGTDKIFPHENVRMALEKYKATDLRRDVLIGKINSRGCRTIGDGSNEKRIAEEYKCQAKKVEIIFPETAKLLRELSNDYAFDGKQDLLFSEIGTSAW